MGALKATDYKQPPQILVQNKGESQHYRLYDAEGLAPTLQSQSGMSSQKHPFVKVKRQPLRFLKRNQKNIEGDYAFTVDSGQTSGINVDDKVRRLMPIETERLMSWPDDWTRWGVNEKGEKVKISDSQRYKMCGNEVVSNVVKEIMKHLTP